MGINRTAQAALHAQGNPDPVSISIQGEPGNGDSLHAAISSDGRFILFTSLATNLVKDSLGPDGGLYLYDLQNGQLVQISSRLDLEAGWEPTLSGDGRFAFYPALNESGQIVSTPEGASQVRVYDRFWGADDLLQPAGPLSFSAISDLASASDGRYLGILTLKTGVGNNQLLFYDRLNAHTITPLFDGAGMAPIPTSQPALSGDGRFLAFLAGNPTNQDLEIVVYNRVLASYHRFPSQVLPGLGDARPLALGISHAGNTLVVLTGQPGSAPGGVSSGTLFHLDIQGGNFTRLTTTGNPTAFRLSADGRRLAYTLLGDPPGTQELRLLDLDEGSDRLIATDIQSLEDISGSGDTLVYLQEAGGATQVYCWQMDDISPPTTILAGRVVDATGHPLALVSVEDGRGNRTRTDGEGVFWLAGEAPGPVQLLATKEGFIFLPATIEVEVETDRYDLSFVYAHDETLAEARIDLGMPYNFDRGDSGPFHGYQAGDCTDLVLDAYTWGVDFNIQFALEQDFRAHPWHFYRWRDARNAHDMWRYFAYSGQLQPHPQPYQPGDIVFFDWSQDGEIDHVAIVSEVNSRNRPRLLLDATGVISTNPGGLAAELPWEEIHERTVRGFARWSGKYEPVILEDPQGTVLQAALGGSGLFFWILDARGGLLSANTDEIPTGRFLDLEWEQSLSLEDPVDSYYLLVVYNPGSQSRPYIFSAQYLQDGLVNSRVETQGRLEAGGFLRFPLMLGRVQDSGSTLTLVNPLRRIEGFFEDR